MSSKTIKDARKKLDNMCRRLITEWKATGNQEFYDEYDAIQTLIEHVHPGHSRSYYLPVKRADIIFRDNLKSFDDLLQNGFNQTKKDYSKLVTIHESIEAWIRIPKDFVFPEKGEEVDILDYVTLIDDEWGQPYNPFYMYYEDTVDNFPFLQKVILEYNKKILNSGIFKLKKGADK